MRRLFLAALSLLALAGCAPSAEPVPKAAGGKRLVVPITVAERTGVSRGEEPVTCGVPLPEGLLADVKGLVLLGPDGRPVPAAFTVVNRWYPEKSVKWVHVDFAATVAGKKKAVYKLTLGKPVPVPEPVKAELAGGKVTVDTGAIKFTVKKDGFNLFDEVWAGGEQIVASHSGGIEIISSHMGLKKNKRYTAAAFKGTTLEIEEKNPMKAVIKVTGRHISTDGLKGPDRLLDYKLRIYAYRGSPAVRVVYTFMNRQEDRIHVPLAVDGIVVDLPTLARGARFALGKADGTRAEGELKGRACVHADASDHHAVVAGEKTLSEGKCKSTKTSDLGWAALYHADGGPGVMGGVRRFWQLWPKAVEVTDRGHLRLHLWPNIDGKVLPLPEQDDKTEAWNAYFKEGVDYPVEKALRSRLVPGRAHMFPGMSKTHEMVFYFFPELKHGQLPRELPAWCREKWMGAERPLRAVCEPSWYCEKTRAFGRLASSNPAIFDKETFELVKGYDKRFRDWLDWLWSYRGREYGKDLGVYDQYGMFDFGDCINWERMKGKYKKGHLAKPVSFHWDNCYYDYPHALMLQFLRTGDLDFLETAVEADHHYIDVDMVCHHPRKDMIGAPRYCPGRMHICQDGQSIYVSNTYNHFKNLCHFDLWFLLGDHHARDRGFMQADFVVKRGRSGLSQSRSIGHGIRGALVAYRASGDEKYLKAAQGLVNYKFVRTWSRKSAAWIDGIALEGFREVYEQTGDEKLVETIRKAVDAAHSKKDHAAAILHAFGFVYAKTGDEKYRAVIIKRLPRLARARKMWGSTQSLGNTLRNAPYSFWYVTRDLYKEVK